MVLGVHCEEVESLGEAWPSVPQGEVLWKHIQPVGQGFDKDVFPA